MIHESRFNYAVSIILKHEGGLTNDKNDRGGITNFGISLRFLKNMGFDINHDEVIDDKDVTSLTRDEAIEIYRKNWWERYGYDKITDLKVATKVFDLAVNCGSLQAAKLLQRAVNVEDDGILGPITLKATNSMNGDVVINRMRIEARKFYEGLVERNPKLHVFLKGWLNRAMW